jgi:SAM-dependent methyltransferase
MLSRVRLPGSSAPRIDSGPDVRKLLDAAYASGSDRQIKAAIAELHALQAHAEKLASPEWVPDDVRLSETYGVQSVHFMIDLLPHLQRVMAQYEKGHWFEVLDVGPGTGHGTAALAAMYREPNLGYRMNVTALDISTLYKYYLPTISPYVNFVQADVFKHKKTYDIVIASHVIEHLTDPIPFCRRLQDIAAKAVFIVAPFKEPADALTRGHAGVIDDDTVAALAPDSYSVVHSAAWGAFKNPPYQMLIAQLAGRASTS